MNRPLDSVLAALSSRAPSLPVSGVPGLASPGGSAGDLGATSPDEAINCAPRAGTSYPEAFVYWLLVLPNLLLVWSFPYLPTQDGPLHLCNALICRDYAASHARYREFFQLSLEPFPNWSSHLLLVGLMYAVPPLAAEKILASLYVVGFAWGFRYFLGAFGRDTLLLAPLGLLFLFNRCFLMGFYNFCLALVLVWVILGYCARRRAGFGALHALVLASLLFLAYFTHLLGYLIAASGAAWLLGPAQPHRLRKLACLAAALAPVACLALVHHLGNPYLLHGAEDTLSQRMMSYWALPGRDSPLSSLMTVNGQLFGPYEGSFGWMGALVLLLYEALVLLTLLSRARGTAGPSAGTGRLPVAVFGLALVVLFVLLPDSLSVSVGFLKARLALLPPLVCLACLRVPRPGWAREVLRMATLLLIGLNLLLVAQHFARANRDLAEYTAGLRHVGRNRTLFVAAEESPARCLTDPLEHASDYYCLTTGNVNLDNFQATLKHFPVRFRPGVPRGRGDFFTYPDRDAVDVILVWGASLPAPEEADESFREVCRCGRLRIFERRERGALGGE
jgi:hypothetical protein